MSPETIVPLTGGGETSAIRYATEADAVAMLVLAHGAGAGQRHPFMVTAARLLAARSIEVVTFDFPYMHKRRGAPDRAPVLEACFRDVIAWAVGQRNAARLFIGGKSMGGRMATHLAAQGDRLDGVVVLGYPLHPPGKPEQPRTAHLPSIAAPVLIVQGERDTFGTPDELRPVLKTIPAKVDLHVVAGGDHSLGVRGRRKEDLYAEVFDAVARWMVEARR